jgi:hypothetical protein
MLLQEPVVIIATIEVAIVAMMSHQKPLPRGQHLQILTTLFIKIQELTERIEKYMKIQLKRNLIKSIR